MRRVVEILQAQEKGEGGENDETNGAATRGQAARLCNSSILNRAPLREQSDEPGGDDAGILDDLWYLSELS